MNRPNLAPTLLVVSALAGAISLSGIALAGGDPTAVVPKLKAGKHSLLEGVQQAQKDNGVAISAKLELEDGKPSLSVYTAKAGLGADAEHNVLMELSGDATAPKWQPKAEVFEDKAHITRAATHLTLVQTTTLTLEDAIKKAEAQKKGTVYSVTPVARAGKTVFEVLVAAPGGKTVTLAIDESSK